MTQQEQAEVQDLESKTKFGIPIDYQFSKPASGEQIDRTAESLKRRGFRVQIVESLSDARAFVNGILPLDKTVFTSSSETLRLSGLGEDIDGAGSKYKSLRKELAKMDPQTQFREMVKMGATPDIVVGSVHAVTENGQVLVASGSGSQLGPYAASAEKVIWVVGSQKLVPDLATGMRRLEMYSYPLEDTRMHEMRNIGSHLAKILIMNAYRPDRTTIILIREAIGF